MPKLPHSTHGDQSDSFRHSHFSSSYLTKPHDKKEDDTKNITKKLTSKTPLLMGILNITPDSFSDGAQYLDPSKALHKALLLIKDGADIIDIGGESTRPGSKPIGFRQEIKRLAPVLSLFQKKKFPLPISLDTRHIETLKAFDSYPITIFNNTSFAVKTREKRHCSKNNNEEILLWLSQKKNRYVILMHGYLKDAPRTYFQKQAQWFADQGVSKNHIWFDPGIGFNKSAEKNISLLAHLDVFSQWGHPTVLGVSKKSCLRRWLEKNYASISSPINPKKAPFELNQLTLFSEIIAILFGKVRVIRTHDVYSLRLFLNWCEELQLSFP